jgi:hypothetical protein
MKKIIVHNPCNEHTRYFRDYNLFWDELTDRLKQKYTVVENRYFENAHKERFRVNLNSLINPNKGLLLMECEYVIEFEDTGEFYVMSVSDDLPHDILNEHQNPLLKKVLVSQFDRNKIESHVTSTYMEKYSPWIYFPCTIDNLEVYYEKRKTIDEFVDKMYFRGSSISDRPIVTHVSPDYLNGYTPIGGPNTYFDDLIKYKVGLSVAGRGELCYRDIEYMCIGIPMLRFNYISELNPNLIPNYHYISVERPDDLPIDRLGNETHAKLLEERFLEVKDNKEFLDFISKNARDYYVNYLSKNNRVKHTLNLLNI